MRIAIFTDIYLEVAGGIPSSIRAQKASLEKLGHKVTVFCPGRKKSKEKSVVVVPTFRFLRVNKAPIAKMPEKIEAFLLKEIPNFEAKFDIVHVHYEANCSLAGMSLAKKFKIPLVQTMHGREDMAIQLNVPFPLRLVVSGFLSYLHGRVVPHERKVRRDDFLAPTVTRARMWTLMVNHANFADRVITPSYHFAQKLEHYGVKKPITVVSNGVADELVEKFDEAVRKKGVGMQRRVEPGEPLKLIWHSRISNEKRVMEFLKAVALMKRPVEVSMYGDGNALCQAKRFVEQKGLPVRFYGQVRRGQIFEKMLPQHLSVIASYGFDTQGMTLLEAEATGLPVFFVDPDMREVVPRAGSVRASGPEPAAMARSLDRVAMWPEKINEMSKTMLECRREILQSTKTLELLKVYKGLLEF